MQTNGEITRLLQSKDISALEKIFPIVYEELHSLAASLFRRESRKNHTLQPTALVHEAYLKLIGNSPPISWQNKAHFMGIAAGAMRQILVNHALAHQAEKRGGGKTLVAFDESMSVFETANLHVLALREALE